jgi:DNA-binding CsgD family transcriptional regulator
MRAAGMSLRQIAAAFQIGYGTVRAALETSERKTLCKNAEENGPFTGISAVR